MLCNNCHAAIEDAAKFCPHCGRSTTSDTGALPQPERPDPRIKRPYAPRKQNTEHGDPYLGYLLMAAFSVFHVLVWQLYSKLNTNWSGEGGFQHILSFLWIIDWVIMLIFAKKMIYRLLISLFFAVVLGFNVYDRYLRDLF